MGRMSPVGKTSLIGLIIGLIGLIGLIVVPASAEAGIKPPPSNLGLVGYWSFDDCRSAKATDFSGSGNTGTLSGFSYTGSTSNWVTGNAAKRGCALNFDGVDDYVDVANSVVDVTAAHTITAWVNYNSDSRMMLFHKGDAATDPAVSYEINHNTGGAGTFGFRIGANSTQAMYASGLTKNAWHHIALVYLGGAANNWKAYLNGVEKTLTTATTDTLVNVTTNVRIGARKNGAATQLGFSGSLDDVRIYNRALSPTEVTALYNSGSAKLLGEAADISAGLVGHWKPDETSGISAGDSSRRGNTGTLNNFALSTMTSNWGEGRRGGGLNFDGSDDYVGLTSNPIDTSASFTVSAWVYYTSSSRMIYFSKGDHGASVFVGLEINEYEGGVNTWGLRTGGGSYGGYVYAGGITPNGWFHLTFVSNGVRSASRMYVNGVSVSTTDGAFAGADLISNPTTLVRIGARDVSGAVSLPWNGSLDDVRIYNRALTAIEVHDLYISGTSRPTRANASTATLQQGTNLTSGLVGHWTFDGQYLNTTTSTDTSGSNNNGTLTGANGKPLPTAGKLGQALSFDGVDDVISMAANSNYAFGTGNFAISQWVYVAQAADVQQNAGLVSHYNGASWFTEIKPVATNTYGFYTGSVHVDSTVAITYGQWVHFAVVREGTGTNQTKMYVNNVLATSFTNATNYTATTNKLWLGNINFDSYPTQYRFKGSLDDVRVYNRALSANEVLQLYNLGR